MKTDETQNSFVLGKSTYLMNIKAQRRKPIREIRTPFANALEKAGIQDFKFHDIRIAFCHERGRLVTLKELLGHSSLQMVMRYVHLASAHKRKLINNLSGKFTNPDKICHRSQPLTKKPSNEGF